MRRMLFLFKVLEIGLPFLHLHHFLLNLFPKFRLDLDHNKHCQEDTEDADNNIELCILLSDSAKIIGVVDCKVIDPVLKLIKSAKFLITADRNSSFQSIVQYLNEMAVL